MSFDNILRSILIDRDVSLAIHHIAEASAELHLPADITSRASDIAADYRLMCDFLRRGFRDEKLDDVYDALLRRLYATTIDMRVSHNTQVRPALATAMSVAAGTDPHPEAVRQELERYVQDVAMAAFGPATGNDAPADAISQRHYDYMRRLFAAFVTAGAWTDSLRSAYSSLLLSPTISTADAMLLVSAVSLSVQNVFDPNKWLALADVWLGDADEELRQRALVGIAFAIPGNNVARLFPELAAMMSTLLGDEPTRSQLLELQTQTLCCCNADADNDEIRRNIMPTLLKNSDLKATRLGIVERDDDPADNILNPTDDDKNIEAMEQSFRRMTDMQKAGADIYFGGFSQMKRFSFFNEPANWFCPFSASHPLLASVREKTAGSKFLSNLEAYGPFCNSDKYSFAFAVMQVFNQLPANLREMMGSKAMFSTPEAAAGRHTPGAIRLDYVQTIYRFHRLYPHSSDFANPFCLDTASKGNAIFFARRMMSCPQLATAAASLGRFLLKRKLIKQLEAVADNFMSTADSRITFLKAMATMRRGDAAGACRLFASLPDGARNDETMHHEAQCRMATKDFAGAADIYRRLLAADAASTFCALNLAVCLLSIGDTDESVRMLFKLSYEHPDNANVSRALAWGLMLNGNMAHADDIYSRLIADGKAVDADLLNGGYAKWLAGDIEGAVSRLSAYCDKLRAGGKDAANTLARDMADDTALLDKHGIKSAERKIIVSLAASHDNE